MIFKIIRLFFYVVFRIFYGDFFLQKRFFHNVAPNSLFLDFGGYLGEWTDAALASGVDEIWIFEPNPDFYKYLNGRYYANRKIKIITDVIELQSRTQIFYSDGLASSSILASSHLKIDLGKSFEVICRPFTDDEVKYMKSRNVIVKMNIEGAEYQLLNYFSQIDLFGSVSRFAIQTHVLNKQTYHNLTVYYKTMSKYMKLKVSFPVIWDVWFR